MIREPIKGEGRYIHGKLKTCKERIKTNFQVQCVLYHTYWNATTKLKVDSVYKKGKNYHSQVYVKVCKCNDPESQQCNILSDSDDKGFFEVVWTCVLYI